MPLCFCSNYYIRFPGRGQDVPVPTKVLKIDPWPTPLDFCHPILWPTPPKNKYGLAIRDHVKTVPLGMENHGKPT